MTLLLTGVKNYFRVCDYVKSKKTTKALEAKLAVVNERLREIVPLVESMADSILKNHPRTVLTMAYGVVPLGSFENSPEVFQDLESHNKYVNLVKQLAAYEYEKNEIETWLAPRKGRPQCRRNDSPKPVDPTIAAALDDSTKAGGVRLTAMQLANKHGGLKTFDAKRKWINRFKQAKHKMRRLPS